MHLIVLEMGKFDMEALLDGWLTQLMDGTCLCSSMGGGTQEPVGVPFMQGDPVHESHP